MLVLNTLYFSFVIFCFIRHFVYFISLSQIYSEIIKSMERMPLQTTTLKKKLTRKEYLIEIDGFVSQVRKAKDRYKRILEMGKQLGYSDKDIASDFRNGMLKAGFSDRTIRRYLPSNMKAKPRGANTTTPNKIRDKLALNQVQEVSPKDFDINNLQQYSNEYLIEIIRYLSHENILLRSQLAMKISSSDDSSSKNIDSIPITISTPITKSKPTPIARPKSNEFHRNSNVKKVTLQEALSYAAKHGLDTVKKYRKHFQEEKGRIPENIPSRPDSAYKMDWSVFMQQVKVSE